MLNAVLGAVGEQFVTGAVPRELLTLARSAARGRPGARRPARRRGAHRPRADGPGPAAAQLRPGSVFLSRLPPLSDTRHVRWAVVHAGADLVVPPPDRAGHPVLRGYGHHSVLRSSGLAALVLDHLRSSEPAPLYQTRAEIALSDQRPATVPVRAD